MKNGTLLRSCISGMFVLSTACNPTPPPVIDTTDPVAVQIQNSSFERAANGVVPSPSQKVGYVAEPGSAGGPGRSARRRTACARHGQATVPEVLRTATPRSCRPQFSPAAMFCASG